jgi:hypothetical protein
VGEQPAEEALNDFTNGPTAGEVCKTGLNGNVVLSVLMLLLRIAACDCATFRKAILWAMNAASGWIISIA